MRKLIHKQEKGHMGQYEDWWYLDVSDENDPTVVHMWDHVRVGDLSQGSGETTYTVEEFLDGKNNEHAKAKLREML